MYDDDGNLVPVVTITSLADYLDDSELLGEMAAAEQELDQFTTHQQELVEMHLDQKKSQERLRQQCAATNGAPGDACNSPLHSAGGDSVAANDENNVSAVDPNVKPVAQSAATTAYNKSCSSSPSSSWPPKIHSLINPSIKQQLKASTLDSESAQFAVSAVLSATE